MKNKKIDPLVAHDSRKADLSEWAYFNRGTLSLHELYATGSKEKWLLKKLDYALIS